MRQLFRRKAAAWMILFFGGGLNRSIHFYQIVLCFSIQNPKQITENSFYFCK